MKVMIDEKQLFDLIKKAVSEALVENIERLKIELIPVADDNEMKDIEDIFGSPEKYAHQDFEKVEL